MRVIEWHEKCNAYLNKRTGTYAFRKRRYGKVLGQMIEMGFDEGDTIVDVGAGRCEFGLYLGEHHPGFKHTYIPVDGAIDGVDLNNWSPTIRAHFYVSIEVLEHLDKPFRMIQEMTSHSTKGAVITTPNGDCTDVLGMDDTHKVIITPEILLSWGMEVSPQMMFTEDRLDTILAWKRPTGKYDTLHLEQQK